VINILDPADYGAVTITKSITIPVAGWRETSSFPVPTA
jgi:hypothetical protein